jgi:hypothetical protein
MQSRPLGTANSAARLLELILVKEGGIVRKPGPARHLTPQNDQLMSERRVLCFKPALRLEWRGQDGQDEAEQCKHYALTLGDSFSRSNADGVFGTHT